MDIGPGDVVVCVHDERPIYWTAGWPLVEGASYVILDLYEEGQHVASINTGEERILQGDYVTLTCDGGDNLYALSRFVKGGSRGMFDHMLVVEPELEDA